MKRVTSVALVAALVVVLAGVAFAQGPGWGPMGGRGMMGAGGRAMGMGGGPEACPMASGATAGPAAEAITEEKARELATEYVNKHLAGFTIERVLPFAGRMHTMYQVELKGPKGETRTLHVTPFGHVRPFGPPLAAAK